MSTLLSFFAVVLASVTVSAGGKDFDAKHIVASFGVVSDVHIDSPDNPTASKFLSALEQLRDKAAEQDPDGLDAILVAGDLINNAYRSPEYYKQVDMFRSLYEKVLDPTAVPLVYTQGNHDVYREWTSDAIAQAGIFDSHFTKEYFATDLDNEAREKLACRHCSVKGVDVLTILPVGRNPVVYTDEQKAWLDARLAEITKKNPSKYVLILTHPMITGTVYGSELGDYWATEDLTPILEKYPQAVTFGGHLHFPLNDPRSIWQGAFTAFGTASVRYMAIENGGYVRMSSKTVMKDAGEYSEGLLIQFDRKGNMRATRMDFFRNSEIDEPWTLRRPAKNLSHLKKYTTAARKAANTAPTLSALRWNREEDGRYTAIFQAGKDDEFVHDYLLTLKAGDGMVVRELKILADFYRSPRAEDMKAEWKEDLGRLAAGTYTLSLTAYDSWGAQSNTLSVEIPVSELLN